MLLDQGKDVEIEKRVGALNVPGNPWRNSAREILALSAYRIGNLAKAEQLYNEILGDPSAPAGVRQRAQAMIALMVPNLAAAKRKTK